VLPGAVSNPNRVREAVFSSTGFRIRAAQPEAAAAPVARWAERIAASLFFTFFPADCRICGSPLIKISRLPVCNDCLHTLRALSGSFCSICGEALPLVVASERAEQTISRCHICQLAPPPFERAVAFGSYDGVLRDLVHLLKFGQVRPAAQVLGRMQAVSIASIEPTVPAGTIVVVPVPLHRHKRSERGFNQAELIARAALKHLLRSYRPERFEVVVSTLMRLRDTGSQIGLTRHQRRQNLRGAFAVRDATPIANRDVLLIDDVYTTGATASECARVLRRAGAARVWVATVGRTLRILDPLMPTDSQEQGREAGTKGPVSAQESREPLSGIAVGVG